MRVDGPWGHPGMTKRPNYEPMHNQCLLLLFLLFLVSWLSFNHNGTIQQLIIIVIHQYKYYYLPLFNSKQQSQSCVWELETMVWSPCVSPSHWPWLIELFHHGLMVLSLVTRGAILVTFKLMIGWFPWANSSVTLAPAGDGDRSYHEPSQFNHSQPWPLLTLTTKNLNLLTTLINHYQHV